MQKVISLNFTPEYIKDYCGKWLKSLEKDKNSSAATIAMGRDILTLVGIACEYLVPGKGDEKENNSKS